MVGVEVRHEDGREVPAELPRAEHLQLRALAAVEQQRAALAADDRGGEVARTGRQGRARAEGDDGEHGRSRKGGPTRPMRTRFGRP